MYISALQSNLAFTAGKVFVYSDFDGTYFPASHSSLHNPDSNKFLTGYSDKMRNFFDKTNGDLHFYVTSGRTYGEYEAVSRLIKKRNFKLPLPESFIAKNGSDEYLKLLSDKDFYEKDIFPFQYNSPNSRKAAEIKSMTNWDGEEIKKFIQKMSEKYKISIVGIDSENSTRDYVNNSFFSRGKLDLDNWNKHSSTIVSRNDGNMKLHFIFPKDYVYSSTNDTAYDKFINEIKTFLENSNTKYKMKWKASNRIYNSCSITPEIDNEMLTKLYDTKRRLVDAVKNNDLVIAAGNGYNDFEMLDPLEYLDKNFILDCKKNSKNKSFYSESSIEKVKDLHKVLTNVNNDYINSLRAEFKQNGFIERIKELPFYGIVIGKENQELNLLYDTFGRLNKVLYVKNGELDTGIKEAVKIHAQNNKQFKNSMSAKFRNYILGINKKLILLAVGGIAALTGGCLLVMKQKSKEQMSENFYT